MNFTKDWNWFKAWKKAFVKKSLSQPTAEEAFKAGWELRGIENQGYDVIGAMEELYGWSNTDKKETNK